MKKKILFVMNDLNCGGSQKSLISLLDNINYNKYEVDLLLFTHNGVFTKLIPKQVNILKELEDYKYFDMSIKNVVRNTIINKRFKVLLIRLLSVFIYKTEKDRTRLEQRIWPLLNRCLPKIKKGYDIAIGYQEKNPIYFTLEKVKAKKKVGWIHTDYSKININHKVEEKYFNRLDNIVTVSDELVKILIELYPKSKDKIECIENIISPSSIETLSDEKIDLIYDKQCTNIISMGRLVDAKGYDISITTCNELIKRGNEIKWYVIGGGGMGEELLRVVRDLNLDNKFIFLGEKENPYPYIKKADLYVQTSRFEGKSIAVEEAKILCKPIVITDFSSAINHIKDGYNGFISDKNPINIANKIELLIKNDNTKEKFIKNLNNQKSGNSKEVLKLYKMID